MFKTALTTSARTLAKRWRNSGSRGYASTIFTMADFGTPTWTMLSRKRSVIHPLWCTNRPAAASAPPGRASADPNGDRHAETRHPIEHVALNLRIGPLLGQNPGLKSAANDGLVPIHRSLNQAPT